MYGYFYSVKENFKFARKEFWGMLFTSIAFAFIISFRKWGVGKTFDVATGLFNLLLAFVFVIVIMLVHISLQKLVAIKLGYKATYSYWLNGILISLFLVFISMGYLIFVLPGSTMIEHIPKLRLGKFRYGTNLKDIARVALAGPFSHVFMIMIAGMFYVATGATKDGLLYAFIIVNVFLAVYSMLPIPKIDLPTRMDAGSDGLGVFFFSRTIYVLVFFTILFYVLMIVIATLFSFIIAFILGAIVAIIYSASLEQKG